MAATWLYRAAALASAIAGAVLAATTNWRYGRKLRLLRRARLLTTVADAEAALAGARIKRLGVYAKATGVVYCAAPIAANASGLQVVICQVTYAGSRRSYFSRAEQGSTRVSSVPFQLALPDGRLAVDQTGAELELVETVAGRKQLVHEEVLAVGKPVLVVGILSSSSDSGDALGFSKGLTNRWLLISHRPEAEIRRDLWVRVVMFGSLSGALFATSIVLFTRGAMATAAVPATAADGVAALRAAANGLALPAR